MSEEPDHINLSPEGDGCALRRGSKLLATLTSEEVLLLAQAAPSFRQVSPSSGTLFLQLRWLAQMRNGMRWGNVF